MLCLAAAYLRRPLARFSAHGGLCADSEYSARVHRLQSEPWPQVGFIAGVFLFALLYTFARRWRTVTLGFAGLGIVVFAFLIVLNVPNSAAGQVRDVPHRSAGTPPEMEGALQGTRADLAGAAQLLVADPLRSVIVMAPSPCGLSIPPLSSRTRSYEARNASPDRSHNETFDALHFDRIHWFHRPHVPLW